MIFKWYLNDQTVLIIFQILDNDSFHIILKEIVFQE